MIILIRLYQKTPSFDHGILSVFYPHGFCRYKPTCSEYAIDAIENTAYSGINGGLEGIAMQPMESWRRDPVE